MIDIEAIRNKSKYQGYRKRGALINAVREAIYDMLSQSTFFVRSTPAKSQVYMKNLKILLSPQGGKLTFEHYNGDTKRGYNRLSNWETSMYYVDKMEIQGDLLLVNEQVAFKL